MDKYVVLSVGNPFGDSNSDTIWGYTTSEEKAKKVCDLWTIGNSKFYYVKNLSYDGGINLDYYSNIK